MVRSRRWVGNLGSGVSGPVTAYPGISVCHVLRLVLWAFHHCNSLYRLLLHKFPGAHRARDDGARGRPALDACGRADRRRAATPHHLHPVLDRPIFTIISTRSTMSHLIFPKTTAPQLISPHPNFHASPKSFWHIGTSGAILIWGALDAPQIPATTEGFAC